MHAISDSDSELLSGFQKIGYYPLMSVTYSGLISWVAVIFYITLNHKFGGFTRGGFLLAWVSGAIIGYLFGLLGLLTFRAPFIKPTVGDFAEAKDFMLWGNPITLPFGVLRALYRFCQVLWITRP